MTNDMTIQKAILEVMKSVGYIQKEKKKGVNYAIKSEEAAIKAIRPAMLKNDIIMYPVEHKSVEYSRFETTKYDGKVTSWNRTQIDRTFRFYHVSSDTYIDVVVVGVGTDTGDKDANGAMTVAKKYALLETFLIQTGDDPDEKASPEDTKNKPDRKTPAEEKKELGYVDKKEEIPFNIMEFIVEHTDIDNVNHAAKWMTKITQEGASPTKANVVALRNKYNKEKE